MQPNILIAKKWLRRLGLWLGVGLLIAAGGLVGLLVGYEAAAVGYDRMTTAHYETHEEETASCMGKPEPCRYGVDVILGLGCATWWMDGGRMMKMYCAPLMPKAPGPMVPEPERAPEKKLPNKPAVKT